MSLSTKTIDGKEYMVYEAGYTNAQAKARAKKIRAKGGQARITQFEGAYGILIPMAGSRKRSKLNKYSKRS